MRTLNEVMSMDEADYVIEHLGALLAHSSVGEILDTHMAVKVDDVYTFPDGSKMTEADLEYALFVATCEEN